MLTPILLFIRFMWARCDIVHRANVIYFKPGFFLTSFMIKFLERKMVALLFCLFMAYIVTYFENEKWYISLSSSLSIAIYFENKVIYFEIQFLWPDISNGICQRRTKYDTLTFMSFDWVFLESQSLQTSLSRKMLTCIFLLLCWHTPWAT